LWVLLEQLQNSEDAAIVRHYLNSYFLDLLKVLDTEQYKE